MSDRKRLGAADPPYMGQATRHYGWHPDFNGEVDHRELLKRLDGEYDGWFLNLSTPSLPTILSMVEVLGISGYRIMAWVKPFAAFKRNVPVAYAWEPVIVKAARTPVVTGRVVMRDWCSEPITMRRGLAGAKPEQVCRWLFEVMGAEPGDELHDLYPGTGAIGRAWELWCSERLNPGVAPSPARTRMDRLPKWAQDHIAGLEAELEEGS